ncbi:unnamed protein product [Rhizophagus irregularis]|nr:unnamed protein product [Rhizophagus irregularis]CAB5338469.1 unnamed protein product [Rhizophagus irregularis]
MLNDILDEKEHMINNNIDLVDRYIDADTKDTFLIKDFIEKLSIYKNLKVILKVDIKKESFEWANKKKLLSSYRLKLEITSSDILDDEIKNLKFEINIKEIDVTKAQIHGIIILLIIIASSTSISIEIKKSLIWILENFQGEDSDRKKINSKYFLDLNVVMNLIESKNLSIMWKELPKKLVSNVTEQNETYNRTDNRNDEYLKISLTNLDYTLFVLRWKKYIIHGDFRNHVKVHNQLKYKSDILMSHYLEDVFYQNELQEIDWKRTFNFLKKEIEEEYKNGDNENLDKFKALRILNIELASFMQEKSKVLILGSLTKVREITRGLFNNKLYDLTRNKIERQVVDEIWERSFLNIRKLLWLKRCSEVEVIEKSKGVSKLQKKRKRDIPIMIKSPSDADNVIDSDNDIKNNKKLKKNNEKLDNIKKEIVKDSLVNSTIIINRHYSNVWGYVHRPNLI